jgi:hypothetical protein
MPILQLGKVYQVMRQVDRYNWRLGMARADVVGGQEVLVGSYDWNTKKPVTFNRINQIGLTGKIFTDEELVGTGFGKLFTKVAQPSADETEGK